MFRVKGWSTFQHYRNRRPPWIKLHRTLLENKEWHKLGYASRALAITIWLMASEHEDQSSGLVTDDYEELAFRARMKDMDVVEAVKELIKQGFIEIVQAEIPNLLAPRYQLATPEGEGETKTESDSPALGANAPVGKTVPQMGKEIEEVVGWADDPRWFGDYSRLTVWLQQGCLYEEDILPTIKRVMKKKTGSRPSNLKYFENAVADAKASRLQPMKEGKPHEAHRKSSGNDKSQRAKAAILDGLGIVVGAGAAE